MSEAPAGWYPTPDGRQRYWDGNQWTEQFADQQASQAPAQGSQAAMASMSPQGSAEGSPANPPDARPVYRKKRFLIPVALVGVIVVASALSGGEDPITPAEGPSSPSASATSSPSASRTTAAPAPTTAAPAPTKAAPEPAQPNAYDDTFGTFKAIAKSGRGDSVVALPPNVSAAAVAMTHKGSSNFSVSTLDATNQSTGDLLANEIGSFAGTAAYGLVGMGGEPTKLKVSADGRWTISITPISSLKELPSTARGKGPTVFLYNGDPADWAITHKGESNFSVNQVGGDFPNLAVNEIGNYTGTVPLDGGPSVVSIGADGTWTFKRG